MSALTSDLLDARAHGGLRVIIVFDDECAQGFDVIALVGRDHIDVILSDVADQLHRRAQDMAHVLLDEELAVRLDQGGVPGGLDREQVEVGVRVPETGRVDETSILDVRPRRFGQSPIFGQLIRRQASDHQLGRAQLEGHPRVECLVGVDHLDVRFPDLADNAGTGELLEVEIGRGDALIRKVSAHGVDHRGRPAEVDVDDPVVQVLGGHVPGDVALVGVVAVLGGDAAGEGEARDPRGVPFQLVDPDQIGLVGDPEDQVDRVFGPGGLDLVEHRQERRQTGAAGQEQRLPLDLAQVETAQRAVELDPIAVFGTIPQIGGQHSVTGVADQESDFIRAGTGAEGERSGLVGARHLDVDVLARKEAQCGPVVHLDRERDGGVGQRVDRGDGTRVGGDAGLGDVGRGGDADDAIRFRDHLAGQDVALLGLVLGHRLVDVVTTVEAAGLAKRLAGPTRPVTTVQRNVDPLPVRRVRHHLVRPALDETSDAVLEAQCDLVAHV